MLYLRQDHVISARYLDQLHEILNLALAKGPHPASCPRASRREAVCSCAREEIQKALALIEKAKKSAGPRVQAR